ncbi:MAG TPA: histidine phosphatase family protein [Candidatus Saccharimonadales bacterium]|nr:histidine phosphatase family protein [Candidatus Saccharimonadales bacterium]
MPKSTAPTELYLIRHAETVMNTNPHLIGGRSNETPLTAKGIEQAKRLGRSLLAKGIMPTKVFASPARRAIDTARYSLMEMGLNMEPLIQDAIQELGQGPAEGKLKTDIYTAPVRKDIARLGKDFKLEGGESMNDVGLRMSGWITETFTAIDSEEPPKYFINTHGGAIKYLASHILGWSHRQTYETEIDNTSVNLFTLQDGVCSVEYLNRDAADI